MKLLRALLAALLVFALPMSSAMADTLNPVEQALLQTRIDTYEAARINGDVRTLMSAMPPKVIPAIARETGASAVDVRGMIADAIAEAYAQQTFQSITLDLSSAEHGETDTGRAYLLIPTETVVTFQDKGYRLVSVTLAFQDNGVWYLSRVAEGPPLQTLRLAYPEFETVAFPQGSSAEIED